MPINPVFRIRFGRKSGKTEKKTFFPFCIIMAQPEQLQEWQGYQRIGLDVRIPKIPILPVFRIRFGHKSGKTVFPFCSFVAYTGQLQKRQGYPRIGLDLRIPTVPIFPVFRIRFGHKSGKTEKNCFSVLHYFGSTRTFTELGKVPPDRA